MLIDSQHFLDTYAEVLNTFNPVNIASFCLPPTIIINDKSKKVMSNRSELETAMSKVFGSFDKAGIRKFVPKLQQTMRLSDTLFFSKMRWQFYDAQEQLCFSCAASYTLQKMPNDELKIIVAVIDDDENQLSGIFSPIE